MGLRRENTKLRKELKRLAARNWILSDIWNQLTHPLSETREQKILEVTRSELQPELRDEDIQAIRPLGLSRPSIVHMIEDWIEASKDER